MAHRFRDRLQQNASVALALLVLAAGWADVWGDAVWLRALSLEPQLWWHLIPLALMAAVVQLRRSHVELALVLGLTTVALHLLIGVNLGLLLCLADLIYALGIRGSRRSVRIAHRSFLGLILLSAPAGLLVGMDAEGLFHMVLVLASVLLGPLWWASEVRRGYPLWQERGARQALETERHAALLERQRQERTAAVESERRRMARELHDGISSQVSAMALTSGAVLNAEPDAERDRRALQTVRTTSVETLDQLREMMRLLRGEEAEDEPTAALSWEGMLSRARAQGVRVDVSGELPADLSPVPRQVAARVAQEALANAFRHGDASAHVEIQARRRSLRLRVSSGLRLDTCAGPDSAPASPVGTGWAGTGPEGAIGAEPLGTGTGLLAMQERVSQAGGRLRCGPDSGAWLVEATLPLQRSPWEELHD